MDFDRISLPREQQRLVENLSSTPNKHLEHSIDKRLQSGNQLQIRWEEHKGLQRQVRVRVVELGKSGLRVQSEKAIAAGTVVNLYTAEFVPIGRASIRECTTRGLDYQIHLYMPGRSTPDL